MFVLFAGAMGISRGRFLFAATLGRSVRYFLEGILALRYGNQAVSFIRDYYPEVAWSLLGAVLAVFCLRLLWHKTMKRNRTR
jgi:membrane protein DedA with SNARE-associated domain